MQIELSVKLGDEELVVEKIDDKLRKITYKGRLSFSKYIPFDLDEEIRVQPTITTLSEIGSECFYLDLSRSIIIPPGRKVELSLSIPMDVKVVLVRKGEEIEIASIPREVKFALYGPPDIGYICRYKKVLEEAENDKFTYTINVTAYNRFTEPLTLSRIIVPLGFFNEKLQHLQLVIENKNFAYVFYKEEAHDVFGSGWFAFRSRNKFIMSYGF